MSYHSTVIESVKPMSVCDVALTFPIQNSSELREFPFTATMRSEFVFERGLDSSRMFRQLRRPNPPRPGFILLVHKNLLVPR